MQQLESVLCQGLQMQKEDLRPEGALFDLAKLKDFMQRAKVDSKAQGKEQLQKDKQAR